MQAIDGTETVTTEKKDKSDNIETRGSKSSQMFHVEHRQKWQMDRWQWVLLRRLGRFGSVCASCRVLGFRTIVLALYVAFCPAVFC